MPGLTSTGTSLATWATGDILIAIITIGFVIAGIACWRLGSGIAAAVAVAIGAVIALGGKGIATSLRGYVGTASLDAAHPTYAALDPSHAVSALHAAISLIA